MPINSTDQVPEIEYKFVFMMDTLTQDILGDNLLENAIDYIEKAVADGVNIVVHCEVGISRSVTLVAAYLMRRFEWSTKKALYFIQERRPNICPNDSFQTQLEIFSHLGYKADAHTLSASPLYRNFCADAGIVPKAGSLRTNRQMSDELASTSLSDRAVPNPRLAPRAHLDKHAPEVIAAQNLFKCRKCRTELFYDTHVLYHSRNSNGTSGGDQFTNLANRCVFEYFVTPLKWMDIDEFQGKIKCPKCKEKLGHFNWGGNKCQGADHDCNTHVSPWFHIAKSKVDKFSANPRRTSNLEMNVPTVIIS
jgi:dual specificity phosphatase 12